MSEDTMVVFCLEMDKQSNKKVMDTRVFVIVASV
jgi:hypothetical protein